MKQWQDGNKVLKLVEGNIALMDVEAVVNAANKSLILGGGVAGAIRSYGGPAIQEECNSIGPIEVGEAVITNGGKLRAKYVIHAAGPVYGEGNEDDKLRKATRNSLELAEKKKIKSIALPAISTGIFRFPIKRCSEIMIKTCLNFLKKHDIPSEIILCLYGEKSFSVFEDTLNQLQEQDS